MSIPKNSSQAGGTSNYKPNTQQIDAQQNGYINLNIWAGGCMKRKSNAESIWREAYL